MVCCVMCCCVVLCCVVLFCVVLCCCYSVVLCCVVLYYSLFCFGFFRCVILCCVLLVFFCLWCGVLCCIMLRCVVLCCSYERVDRMHHTYRAYVTLTVFRVLPPALHIPIAANRAACVHCWTVFHTVCYLQSKPSCEKVLRTLAFE